MPLAVEEDAAIAFLGVWEGREHGERGEHTVLSSRCCASRKASHMPGVDHRGGGGIIESHACIKLYCTMYTHFWRARRRNA